MALFKVTNIIDGTTIEVVGWAWGDYAGRLVKVEGYTIKDPQHEAFAKGKLNILLNDKMVELKNVIRAEKRQGDNNDIIHCSVFLNDIDIAQYFPELTAK